MPVAGKGRPKLPLNASKLCRFCTPWMQKITVLGQTGRASVAARLLDSFLLVITIVVFVCCQQSMGMSAKGMGDGKVITRKH